MFWGKSMLLAVLLSLLAAASSDASSNEVFIYAAASTRPALEEVKKKIRGTFPDLDIKMVFGSSGVLARQILFPHLSVEDNLLFGHRRQKRRFDESVIDHCIEILKLRPLLSQVTANLSGGEKQCLALGRALFSRPRMLILDEVLTGMDQEIKEQVAEYIKKLCCDMDIPYLFITHDANEMRIMTDEVITLNSGKTQYQNQTEYWMRQEMFHSFCGYINLINLEKKGVRDNFGIYAWNDIEITALNNVCRERVSARNLFACMVKDTWEKQGRVGVELAVDAGVLVAEVARSAAEELRLERGSKVFAAIKASSFQIK